MEKTKQDLNAEIQEKALQLQMLDEQLKQFEQHAQLIDEKINELQILIVSLDELKKSKEGSSILTPFGNSVFIKAKLENKSDVWLDIGKNVVVKKSVSEAQEFLSKKLKEFINARNNVSQKAKIIIDQISKLDTEVRMMASN